MYKFFRLPRHGVALPVIVLFGLIYFATVLLGRYRLSGCNHRNTVVSLGEKTENELVEVSTPLILECLDGSFNLWCCPVVLTPHLIHI